jgi:hypothetical protein
VLEDDIGLLNLINFGGGCYALYAQIEGDTVAVQKETYGDRFARPARLSPLEAKALLWALDFIGDRLPTEAGGSLSSVRAKVEAAMGGEGLPTVEPGGPRWPTPAWPPGVSHAIRETGCWRSTTGPSHGPSPAHHRAALARQRAGRVVRRGLRRRAPTA